ncbi:MAG: hypothetical protein AVO34_06210 [Firmicutes bacterium ML8_F2]|nr:MAG: hypothetical protein AVO34_06210 [Firmicutes bacterium ML8_F2]
MKTEKQYHIWQIPPLAFFSRALYRDVALRWRGVAFGYLLLLLALCWIPGAIRIHRSFAFFVDEEAPLVIEQIPDITIIDGQAFVDLPQPYTIHDPETEEALVVIDTTGTITSLEQTDARGLVTARQVVFKKNAIETRAFSFETISRYTLDQGKIYDWLDIAKTWAAPMLYPLCTLGSFAYRIVQVLLYACIGLLLAILCKGKLPFDALLRMSVVAITPAIIIGTLLDAAAVEVPLAWLWFFLLAMGYLLFGIRAAIGGGDSNFKFESANDPTQPRSP